MMISITFFILILQSCQGLDDLNSSVRNFSIELVNSISLDNFVLAPFNVWCVIAGAGLWTRGETQEEISKSLNLPWNHTFILKQYTDLQREVFINKPNDIHISNGIFIYTNKDNKLDHLFKVTMALYFGAVIKTLNFKDTDTSAKRANDFVAKNVRGNFNIFQPIDFVNTTMIMSNVISFNGSWKSEFDVSDTTIKRVSFVNNPTAYVFKNMHKTLKLPYSNMESLNSNVMELAIGEYDKFCLLLILPHPGMNIREVYKKLYGVTLKDIFDKLQSDVKEFGLKEMNVTLPRVKIVTAVSLNKPLNDIGLKTLFDYERANFLGITMDDNMYIASVDHTCEVEFLETGVYAMASTPGYYDYNIIEPKIEADEPFIFFLMEKVTQTILFGGLYSKPSYTI